MNAAPKNSPGPCRISITLSDDDQVGNTPRIFHPGDLLQGHVHIDYDEGILVEVAVLTLEGTVRNWVDHETSASAVKHDFLRQSQQLSRQQPQEVQATKTGRRWTTPFKFRIASRCFPNDGLSSQMSLLPPSLATGRVSFDQHGNKCMQPLIGYGIRAVVAYRPDRRLPCRQSQGLRSIELIPWSEAAPPCSIDDFPGEFTPVAKVDLRRRLARTSRGELTLSMCEPKPLAILAGSHHTCKPRTEGMLRLSLQSPQLLAENGGPPSWACFVETLIIKKTYYSTMPLSEAASTKLTKTNKYVRHRREVLQTASWAIDPLCWDRERAPRSCSKATCTATVPVPVECREKLLPTFCSPLSAIRYSLRVFVRIVGVHHDELAVEVPLQIYHCRQNQQSDDPPPIDALPTPQHCLGGMRAVDEVLEIEPPPSYYA